MALNLINLDERTRTLMIEEVDMDISQQNLYISPRLTTEGQQRYPDLLKEAIRQHDDQWLAKNLQSGNFLKAEEQRRKPNGGYTIVRVPITAPVTLAEGEFNRFYCRAVCLRAIQDGIGNVEVYRAKDVTTERPESKAKIGSLVSASELLSDLRTHQGVEPALGLPPGPNSGLSIRIPQERID